MTSSETTEEPELIARALTGDRDAWGALYARYNGRVVAHLIGQGVPAARALEFAQEAWAKLIERAQRGALTEIKLPGLVIVAARNLARDDQRRPYESDPMPANDPPHPAPSAVRVLLGRERLASAMRAIDALPRRAREIFLAYHADPDRPHAELAAELNVSLQHLRTTLYESRKAVSNALGGEP
jgi:RNA polymerase sigma-70 factor (ECF subfamily)